MTNTTLTSIPYGYQAGRDISQMQCGVSSVAVGDCLQLDESAVDTTTGLFYKLKQAATATLNTGRYCIAATAGSSATDVITVVWKGDVKALIVATPAIGTHMAATNAARGLTAASATAINQKVIAVMRETGVAAALKKVDFDGVAGFGYLGA